MSDVSNITVEIDVRVWTYPGLGFALVWNSLSEEWMEFSIDE